jgi:type II secretory pathway component PulF
MEVNLAMESFVAAIEPVMISVMGCFVGVIIFIMLSPLYNLIARLNI